MKKLCWEFVMVMLGLIIEYYQHNLHSSFSWAEPQTIHSIFIFTDLHRLKPVKMFSDTLLSLVQTSPQHHCFRFARFVLSSLPLLLKRKENRNLKPGEFAAILNISPWYKLIFKKFADKEYWLLEVREERRGEEMVINLRNPGGQASPLDCTALDWLQEEYNLSW